MTHHQGLLYDSLLKLLVVERKYARVVDQRIREAGGPDVNEKLRSARVIRISLELLPDAKIILMQTPQAKEFLDIGLLEQDHQKWLRLPYPTVHVELVPGSISLNRYQAQWTPGPVDVEVKAITLCEDTPELNRFFDWKEGYLAGYERAWRVAFWFGHDECHVNTFGIKDGRLMSVIDLPGVALQLEQRGEVMSIHRRLFNWAVHCINFLSSPSVGLEKVKGHSGVRKELIRQAGFTPPAEVLPHEIVYRKWYQLNPEGKASGGFTHHYRYDVRGHFKVGKQGRWKGRVVWCPPHQRGLANELYKPKRYIT